MNSQKYWDKINCGWDAFSLPKEVAFKLIMMHKKHGDTIFLLPEENLLNVSSPRSI